MTHRAPVLAAAMLLSFGAAGVSGVAAQQTAAIPHNTVENGVAVHGYDVVAYFVMRKPVKGSAAYQVTRNGVTWRFASAIHKTAFLAQPERYMPRYGGFCAQHMRDGVKSDIDPTAWTIHAGRLFLMRSSDQAADWRQDPPANVQMADRAWRRLVGGEPGS